MGSPQPPPRLAPTGSLGGSPGILGPLASHEIYRPIVRSALVVAAVFLIGVVGYRIIGGERYGWIDAVYMTVVTLTTVGFREVIDVTASFAGRIFTVVLILGGVGAFLYFFSAVTAFFVEGNVARLLWRKRMRNAIARLSEHTIVCGAGYTGQHVVAELLATERPFVVIDHDEERIATLIERLGQEFPTVIGDATDDDTLRAASIERASGIIACISNDNDNLIVTVSARILRPGIRIVSRCIDEKVEEKILKAGADAVVSPSRIGGLRMISEMLRPTAVSYLELMLRDKEQNLRVESTTLSAGSPLAGGTLADLKRHDIQDLLVLALRRGDDAWTFAPADDARLDPGVRLIYVGSPQARRAVETLALAEPTSA